MVTVTIDDKKIEVAEGTNLVEAAKKAGVEIPTYCYHPGLSVVGQCRICMVAIQGVPRPVIACSIPVREGMVVDTRSEAVRQARAAVMEFLLANHPLDCPVCDQAGECYLQDYSVEHGLDTTHMVEERRTFPGLERRLIGPHVVQNQNRCIHCTRCVRFTQEISETNDLTMKARGNHPYIDTFDGGPFDNPWSACAADVCPVGALTVKEFRFRARVWHLEDTDSICFGCSIGCAIKISHYQQIVHRFLPRHSPEINGWWMCDYGRFLAEGLNRRDVMRPTDRSGGEARPVIWSNGLAALHALLAGDRSAVVVASANLSNEALFLVHKVLVEAAGLQVVVPIDPGEERKVKNSRSEWVHNANTHPNSTGARMIGFRIVDEGGLEAYLTASRGAVVFLDADAHPWLHSASATQLVKGRAVAVLARTSTPLVRSARLVLPAASWVETEGTYTSSTGRVQLAHRGFGPLAEAKPVWEIVSLLGQRFGLADLGKVTPRTIFERLVAEIPAFAGVTYRRLAIEPGVPVLEGEATDVG